VSRPRSSARVIELHGNPSKVDVEKRAAQEVRPDPIAPSPPSWLRDPVALATWKYLALELEADALLTKRDRETFAFLCSEVSIAAAALKALQPNKSKPMVLLEIDESHQGRTRRNPALMVYGQAVERYRRLAAEFGLSPRMRLPLELTAAPVVDGDEDEDDDLFAQG
jgi:P27 family predicted phage terminase small subunit